ncbi:aryl-alcohol dehydrogenase, partial [Streptococcus sobrinus]
MQELRLLGHSNLSFSPLGLGTWQFSNKDKGRT